MKPNVKGFTTGSERELNHRVIWERFEGAALGLKDAILLLGFADLTPTYKLEKHWKL